MHDEEVSRARGQTRPSGSRAQCTSPPGACRASTAPVKNPVSSTTVNSFHATATRRRNNRGAPEKPTFVPYHLLLGPREHRYPETVQGDSVDVSRIRPATIERKPLYQKGA